MEESPTHFCGTREAASASASLWRKRRLAWCLAGEFPTLDAGEARAAFREAFASWQAVCGLAFLEVADPSDADILVTVGRIDGAMGVLAWSELPPGDDRRLTQKYDSGEQFVIALRPPRGRIDLVATATHEIGHAIGLDHAPQGAGDLMEPMYEPGRRTPQPGDVRRIVGKYGPPAVPTPDAGRVPSRMVILDQNGAEMARYKIARED